MLKLYDYWRSSAAYRVRIGLALKGVDYQSIPINIMPGVDEQMREPYRSKNPQMRVPALETEKGLITQSMSILVWLDQTYPEPRLMPADPWLGAQVRSFALTIATDIHPLNNTSVLTRIKLEFSADDDHVGEWYRHWIKLGFNALEHQAEAARLKPNIPSVMNRRSPMFVSCRRWPMPVGLKLISRHSRVSWPLTKPLARIPPSSKRLPKIRRTQ